MRKRRDNQEMVVLRHLWPALLFAAVWLRFPGTRSQLTVDVFYVYALLGLIALVTLYRMRLAVLRPNAPILRYLPVLDSIVLALAIRFTGGVHSDLWLFYYFQLVAAAMDPRQRTIEVMSLLVVVSYLSATLPDAVGPQWAVIEVVGTRLFFLFLTSMLIRHIARIRNRLSEELGHLSEQLSLSQERNRIAREIHDGVGHSLVNCILTLELCERLVCDKPSEACKIIEQEKTDLRSALDDMRDYVHHLRPAEIENEEFVPLIKRQLARFAERTSLKARLDLASEDVDLAPSGRLVLLRIVQEALTNAAKHSDATEVDVNIAKTSDSGIHCVITDNGCGFEANQVLQDPGSRQGFGIRTMRDRAAGIGGDVQIESTLGVGTRISVYIPG